MGTRQEKSTQQTARSSRFYQAGRSRNDGSSDDASRRRHNGDKDKDIDPSQRRNLMKDAESGGSRKKGSREDKGGRPRDAAPISSVGSRSSARSQPSSGPAQQPQGGALVDGEVPGDDGSGGRNPAEASAKDVTLENLEMRQNTEDVNTKRSDSAAAKSAPAAAAPAAVSPSPSPAMTQLSPAEPDKILHAAVRSSARVENTSEGASRGSRECSDQQEGCPLSRPRTQARVQQSELRRRDEKSADNVPGASKQAPVKVASKPEENPQQNHQQQQQRQRKSRSNKPGNQKVQQRQQRQQRPQQKLQNRQHQGQQEQQQKPHAAISTSGAVTGSAVSTSATSSSLPGGEISRDVRIPNDVENTAAGDENKGKTPEHHEFSHSESTHDEERFPSPGRKVSTGSKDATRSIMSQGSALSDVVAEMGGASSREPLQTPLPAEEEALRVMAPMMADVRSVSLEDGELSVEQQQHHKDHQDHQEQHQRQQRQEKRRKGQQPRKQPAQPKLHEVIPRDDEELPVSGVASAQQNRRPTEKNKGSGEKKEKRHGTGKMNGTTTAVTATAPTATEGGKGRENPALVPRLILESVEVTGDIAQWAAENSRGGEFTTLLETVRRDSGAASVDTRVVLKNGKGQGGRAQMEKVHVDVRASTSARARVARALLVTHLKSRSELLRLEQRRRSMEGSLSAFEREVSQGLRVQFATRSEWIGLLVGKAGARIRDIRNATGCSVEVIDGRGSGGQRGDFGQGDCDGAVGAAATDGGAYGSGGHARAALPCRVVISGPTADSVQEAREQMELVEVSIPIDPKQAVILGRLPRTKLQDLRQQSECLVVDLQSFPSPCEGQQQSLATTESTRPATSPAVRVIGPRSTVDSARMLLGVILEYVNREREMREGDTVVRKRLMNMQASFGHPSVAGMAEGRKAGRGGSGGGGRGGRGGREGRRGRGGRGGRGVGEEKRITTP